MSKKLKTQFIRIAVAGLTASDGRTIEAQWLRDMADTYNTSTYTARVNVEHYRNASATGPFPALGDVIALKVQEDDLEIGGKTEKRVALYAQIEGNETLQGYVAADQKKFTSIEVEPNFSGTGKAYLMGLAATDSPASLGTEALQFSARTDDPFARIRKADLDARKQHATCLFSAALETKIEFADDASPQDGDNLVSRIIERFARAVGADTSTTPAPAAAQPPQALPVTPDQSAAFATALTEISQTFSANLKQATDALNQRFAKLESEQAALVGTLSKTTDPNYTARPVHAGGDGADQTDC